MRLSLDFSEREWNCSADTHVNLVTNLGFLRSNPHIPLVGNKEATGMTILQDKLDIGSVAGRLTLCCLMEWDVAEWQGVISRFLSAASFMSHFTHGSFPTHFGSAAFG